MSAWRLLPQDATSMHAPIGLRLIDDLTGKEPRGSVSASLEIKDGADWLPTRIEAVVTPSKVVAYPGLGRQFDTTQPPQHYRVVLDVKHYIPSYRTTDDGVEFDAPPYNDVSPPVPATSSPIDTVLLPAVDYPFSAAISVLHGVVQDVAGDPVADVLVQEGLRERVITDTRGAFSLPLRWVNEGVPTVIDATDIRNGRIGAINVTLPAALTQNQTITVA
ncbi:MAG: hypothetical protein GY906_14010 [bacterium]|nr:hypothetical protein [bacterium]